jgi:WD40 repeat protein
MQTAAIQARNRRRPAGLLKRLGYHLEGPLRYLFGDDIFISYSRQDGLNYAQGIASQLAAGWAYSCRVDLWETVPGVEMPASLRRSLRWSKMLVLVGTPGAATSVNVGLEVAEFMETGGIIVPIDFENTVMDAIWYEHIHGLPLTRESSATLDLGRPSERVMMRIHDSFEYVKRSQRVRRTFRGLLALVGVVLLAGLGLLWLERQQFDALNAQQQGQQAIMLARSPGHEMMGLAKAVEVADEYLKGPIVRPDAVFGGLLFGFEAVTGSHSLIGHRGRVSNVVTLPGYRLATIATDSTVRFWNRLTWRVRVVRDQLTNCHTAVLSPDSTLLVTTSPLRVWDVRREQVVAGVEPPGEARFQAVAWSTDGRRLAAVSTRADSTGTQIWVWDVVREPGEARARLVERPVAWHDFARQPHAAYVIELAFLPDQPDQLLLSTTRGAVLGDLRQPLTHPVGSWQAPGLAAAVPAFVAVALTDKVVVMGSHDTLYVRDARTLKCRETYWVRGGAFAERLNSVGLSRDGRQVVGVFRNAVFFWDRARTSHDLPRGRIRRFEGTGFKKVTFSSNGHHFLLDNGGKSPGLWSSNIIRERILTGHIDMVTAATFSALGRRVLTASADGEVRIWNLREDLSFGQRIASTTLKQLTFTDDDNWLLGRDTTGAIQAFDLRPTGKLRAAATAKYATGSLADNQLLTVDSSGHVKVRVPDGVVIPAGALLGKVLDLQGANQGKALLALTRNGKASAVLQRYLHHEWKTYSASPFRGGVEGLLLPNGQQALVLSSAGGVALVDLEGFGGGEVLRRETPRTGRAGKPYRSLAVSSSGHFVLLRGAGGVLLLDTHQHQLYSLRGYTAGIIAAAFSADEARVVTASSDGVARVWQCRDGSFVNTCIGGEGALTAVTCGPGDWVATGANNGMIRLWNGATCQAVGVLPGHQGPITALRFTRRGDALWSAGCDGVIRQFTLDPQWYLRQARVLVQSRTQAP